MLSGETHGLTGAKCSSCGRDLDFNIQHSAAGYYLGYFCDLCGPESRESTYFKTWERAESAMRETLLGSTRWLR